MTDDMQEDLPHRPELENDGAAVQFEEAVMPASHSVVFSYPMIGKPNVVLPDIPGVFHPVYSFDKSAEQRSID